MRFSSGLTEHPQIMPGLDYLKEQGNRKPFPVGGDHVFPGTAGEIIKTKSPRPARMPFCTLGALYIGVRTYVPIYSRGWVRGDSCAAGTDGSCSPYGTVERVRPDPRVQEIHLGQAREEADDVVR
ncbi:hypothetical protein Psi02_05600 [Planotetraspora silvatica]|uniref:Uncharacterized protein n=1 Tax=Planotetraspora silvatica TaxID=234614 RepID=A0A8J3XLG0_9ACTN|nr:hypothetical protein [Planotetraspora silvatica]GII44136.1 hypothetical protein Psi02_05600 [Planotetraspora silvatica]